MSKTKRSSRPRLIRDRKGAAAVEFAMILPVMLLLYIGTFEASDALITKRRVDNAAETVGGIVARSPEMDDTRMRNVLLISDAIVGRPGDRKPEITITTVKTDANGKATVDWSRKGTAVAATRGTPYSLPPDLKDLTNAYFVFAKVTYRYVPLIGLGGEFGALDFERTFAFRPRKGSEIAWK
ncbi:pilus assembly protein [Aureimonas sp. SK2]|uniref:TadE/TadG family type IV pilus assembly protein n=1 Tax=Aureimonas sp. SK2 TaxID=3015992 RepID=UPI0024451243|nr:pilus assembly protein [Aureimonas sp. SK2]